MCVDGAGDAVAQTPRISSLRRETKPKPTRWKQYLGWELEYIELALALALGSCGGLHGAQLAEPVPVGQDFELYTL